MHSHILLKATLDISNPLLTNIVYGSSFLIEWIRLNDMNIISKPVMHKFETEKMCLNKPGGISGIALLCESHVSIHTYPETRTIYADIFSCRYLDKGKNIEFIKRYSPQTFDLQLLHRN
jgi:S-adenosylmethionine decarboxylase